MKRAGTAISGDVTRKRAGLPSDIGRREVKRDGAAISVAVT